MKLVVILILLFRLDSVVAKELSAKKIIQKAYGLEDGSDFHAKMIMKIFKANGEVRERNLRFLRRDFGSDSRTLFVFEKPPLVAGTAFLTWNHKGKENDQWLYLPALKRVKRIAGAAKTDSFMGSDFSYEDLSKRAIEKDLFHLNKNEKIREHECFVIVAKAKDENEEFPTRHIWVRQDNFVISKIHLFNRKGKLVKQLLADQIIKVQGIWTTHHFEMKNILKNTRTVFELSQVKYNTGIPKRKFKTQALK